MAGLPEASGFALAGGAALIVHRLVDRETNDLDFFTPRVADVPQLLPALEEALQAAGLRVTRDRVLDTFARLTVSDDESSTVVDIAWDYRLRPPVDTPLGKVVAEDELAADKLLALAGRVEARDYLDVARLAERHSLDGLCRLAEQKDPGFRRWALADMLAHFEGIPRQDFDIDDSEFEKLRRTVASWRTSLAQAPRWPAEPPTREPPDIDR